MLLAAITTLLAAPTAYARDRISPQRENVVRTLNRGLYGTPMRWTGRELEAAGWKHHVSPYLIAAIAGTESSFGAAACSSNRFNAFGLASCGSSWHVPAFRSWAHAYDFMGRFLSSRWRGHSSPWSFRGYAACSDCWARKVAHWMRARFGAAPVSRYGP